MSSINYIPGVPVMLSATPFQPPLADCSVRAGFPPAEDFFRHAPALLNFWWSTHTFKSKLYSPELWN